MDQQEKYVVRARFALAIKAILAANKQRKRGKKENDFVEHKLVPSLRQLEASSGVIYSILQRITSGKRNPELTTIAAIAAGFEINEVQFFQVYLDIPLSDIEKFVAEKIIPYEKKQELLRKRKRRGDEGEGDQPVDES